MRELTVLLAVCTFGAAFASDPVETECQQSQIVVAYVEALRSPIAKTLLEWRAKTEDRISQAALGMVAGDEGVPLLESAAKQGSIYAMKMLHIKYASPKVVTDDTKTLAARWAAEGARRDDMDMQRQLGDYFSEGRGLPKDSAMAVHWWKQAAEKGSRFAQGKLAQALADGRGVDRNDVEALKWATLASRNLKGSALDSLRVLDIQALRSQMPSADITQAELAARDWLSRFEEQELRKHNANEKECGIREFDKGALR